MNKVVVNVIAGAIIALVIATGSSYVTFLVVNHFNYVDELEKKVLELDGDNEQLTQEVLGLKSTLVEPPSNLK